MDLRFLRLTPAQLKPVETFIIQRKLAYQPFIFSETLEVGEGLKFHDGEAAGVNVYWKNGDKAVADLLVSEADLPHFRECNAHLRRIYEHMMDSLIAALGGDISRLSFAEIGCNTGYFLHRLALRGAARCLGLDFTNNDRVFDWFNQALGTHSDFKFAEWDSLRHMLRYAELPQVDVNLSVAVTCHLPDPLYFLTYLCERSRQAVFLSCPVSGDEGLSITLARPGKYPNALSWPVSCDNGVLLSVPLLKLCLAECGFERVVMIEPPELSPRWLGHWRSQCALVAFRTAETKSAFGTGLSRRHLPSDAPLRALTWRG